MFYEFLQTLGWPVEVQEHPGWTGNPTSSWKLSYLKNQTLHEDTNPSNRSTVSSHGSESDSSLTAVHEEHTTSGSGSQDGSRDGEGKIFSISYPEPRSYQPRNRGSGYERD